MRRYALIAVLAAALAGCASVPMGDAQKDIQVKQFTKKPDVAGLYIYRNEVLGAAITLGLDLDGRPLGKTAAKTYFFTELPAGKHTITSKAENTDTLDVDLNAGSLYYVWQEVKMGLLSPRAKLHLVDEEEGKKGVLESKLAAPIETVPATLAASAPAQ